MQYSKDQGLNELDVEFFEFERSEAFSRSPCTKPVPVKEPPTTTSLELVKMPKLVALKLVVAEIGYVPKVSNIASSISKP